MADQSTSDKCSVCEKQIDESTVPFDGMHPACAGKPVRTCWKCKVSYGDIGLGERCPFCK